MKNIKQPVKFAAGIFLSEMTYYYLEFVYGKEQVNMGFVNGVNISPDE